MDYRDQVGITCSCCTCGYEWPWGQDGSHSCAQTLLGVIAELKAGERRRQIDAVEILHDRVLTKLVLWDLAEVAEDSILEPFNAKLRELRENP